MALPILDGNQTAATLSTVLTAGEHIPAHTVVSLGSQAITDMRSAVSGSVVSISNFPSTQTIAGTVTANANNFGFEPSEDLSVFGKKGIVVGYEDDSSGEYRRVRDNQPLPVTINPSGAIPAISGTVTANLSKLASHASSITKADNQIQIIGGYSGGSPTNATAYPLGVESTGYINSNLRWGGTGVLVDTGASALPVQVVSQGTVTIGSLPSGALTTRFGSVATANLAFITSAVTNTSRKYLLAQNISAGTVTIGIGFSPTTTQGIQLTAGGGLTFDAFCPTGAVYWLGAVTGAAFSILEG